MTANTDLAQRIAELPELPPYDYYVTLENGDDYGVWSIGTMKAALAAQAPLVERIKELEAVLREARETLQFANDSPGGPISDTIWMMHRPETLFDFLDAALAMGGRDG